MTETEKAWLAGLVDGEGSVGLYCGTSLGYRNYFVLLRVKMTHAPTISKVRKVTGLGNIQVNYPRNTKHRPGFMWSVSSKSAVSVMKEILPYSITKREQIEAALLADERRGYLRKYARKSKPAAIAEMEQHRDILRRLNRRGTEGAKCSNGV